MERIEKRLDKIQKSNEKILQGMNSINKKYEEIKAENIQLKRENEEIKKRITNLESKVNNKSGDAGNEDIVKKVKQIEQTQHESEQYSRNKNIEIFGVEECKNEKIRDTIHRLVEGLKIEHYHDNNIEKAHRLPSRNKTKTPTILVQFKTRQWRDDWLKGRQGRINNDDIFQNGNKDRIFVNEHLTPFYKALMWKTKQSAKKQFKYIWFNNGKIHLKKDDESKVQFVKSERDLEELVKGLTQNDTE